jgi:hypothetical protein
MTREQSRDPSPSTKEHGMKQDTGMDPAQAVRDEIVREMVAEQENSRRPRGGGGASPIYGLGMIGAGIYYWRKADAGAGPHALALGKALVWPAYVVYDLLRHLEGEPTA